MKAIHSLTIITMLLFAGTALAQEEEQPARNDQADVWAVVEQQWDADENGERGWIEGLLTEEFSGWEKDSPAPRTRASTAMWDRVTEKLGKPVAHELYPLSIVVRGDTAVAHYLYTRAYEEADGELEFANGRYTDVLVRTDEGWKFIAWQGGDD